MQSSQRLERNLRAMEKFARSAAKKGARWILFPEMAYLLSEKAQWRGEIQNYHRYLAIFQNWARDLGVVLFPGTLREPAQSSKHFYNTLPVISSQGELLAAYRKIHLFQANLPDRRYNEAAYTAAGSQTLVVTIDGIQVGLSICFDLRFPELYRKLRQQGAQVVVVPSAFTYPTGKAHWEILLRARAIENQVFVLAPDQTGKVGTGSRTFGHSMIVSPWGEVLKKKPTGEGILLTSLPLAELDLVTQKIAAWDCRRVDVFS